MLYTLVLSGHHAVMQQAALLESLAERCEQPGAMNWLSHFLTVPSFKGKKKPFLALIVRPGVTVSSLAPENVHAAVLLFEYRVVGMPTGVFSTDDWGGFRTVVAPEAERGAMAAMAADALMKRGAQMVLMSYGHALHSTSRRAPALAPEVRGGWRTRPGGMALSLEPTLQATLAKLGKSTRFNLGYYRRRLAAAVPCEFVAAAVGLLQEEELKALNAGSLNPISPSEFRHLYESCCRLPGGYLLGLRSSEGRWLSLIGGWRQGSVTVLYWQMNAAGYEKLSIGSAMRSYYLEHEVGRGTKTLVYYGGTAHSLGHSFVREEVTDLIVQRRSLRSAALRVAAQMVTSPRSGMRINSVLAHAIGSGELDWHSMENRIQEPEPQSSKL